MIQQTTTYTTRRNFEHALNQQVPNGFAIFAEYNGTRYMVSRPTPSLWHLEGRDASGTWRDIAWTTTAAIADLIFGTKAAA